MCVLWLYAMHPYIVVGIFVVWRLNQGIIFINNYTISHRNYANRAGTIKLPRSRFKIDGREIHLFDGADDIVFGHNVVFAVF